jgi:hypothetical protein
MSLGAAGIESDGFSEPGHHLRWTARRKPAWAQGLAPETHQSYVQSQTCHWRDFRRKMPSEQSQKRVLKAIRKGPSDASSAPPATFWWQQV